MLEPCWGEALAVLGQSRCSLLGQTALLLPLSGWLTVLAPRCCSLQPAKLCPCGDTAGDLCPGVPRCPVAEALFLPVPADTYDEVAQYLDHLLQRTVPQSNLPPTAQQGGLKRFRAAVHTTRDLMSLASKAKDLQVQSE